MKHLNGYGSKLVSNAIKKYKKDNFIILIIHKENCNNDELNNLEKYYINYFNTITPNGYNMTKGGDGNSREYMSDEQKLEYSKKMSMACKGINTGKRSEELKNKISETTKVAMNRPDVKSKIKLNRPDYKGESNPFYKKNHTEESKNKMAESHKGNTYSAHIQWHINRGIINPVCKHCVVTKNLNFNDNLIIDI